MIVAEAPWTAVRDALQSGKPCVAILPCGAIEAHGPHLPLNTDVIIAEAFAQHASEWVAAHGVIPLLLPALAYAPAEYAHEFAGTIGIRAETAVALIADIADNLRSQGFACLALANSHFDPANVEMLRDTATLVRNRGLKVAFPDFTRRALAQTLTEEFISGACHAGQFETSIVLASRPDLVNDAARADLPANEHSLTLATRTGLKTFAEAGGPDAYFGAPARASAEEGRNTIEIMGRALGEAIMAELPNSTSSIRRP
jgi:creatinine amidohydrolase